MVRGPPGLAHTRQPGIALRGRCRLSLAAALLELLLSLALGIRRSLPLWATAASPRRAPSLRPPSSASGPGVESKAVQTGAGRRTPDADQLGRARAGATGGGGCQGRRAPVVESPVLRTGLIDYFLLKDPAGGGAT